MNPNRQARRVRLTQSPWQVVLALTASMALAMTSYLMIMPLFARRFSDFGAGVQALGLSDLAAALGGIIAASAMGALADRIGRRPIVLALAAVQVLAMAGFLAASSAESYILLRGLSGACMTGIIPAVMGIVADVAPPDRRAQYIGVVNGGSSAGWMVGPLFGGFLYDNWTYQVPFALAIIVALLALLFVLLLVPETRGACKPPRALPGAEPFAPVVGSGLARVWVQFSILLVVSFATLFAWAFIQPQFMFYGYDEMHWTSSALGLIISIYGVAIMLGEFTLGRLSDRLGRKPVLVLGLALFSAQFFGLALSDQYTLIACSFVIAGLGNAIFDPALGALFLDLAPEGYKSRVMGLKTTASSLGSMAGPALAVLLAPYLASRGVFVLSLLLVLGTALVTILSLRVPAPKAGLRNWEMQVPSTLPHKGAHRMDNISGADRANLQN